MYGAQMSAAKRLDFVAKLIGGRRLTIHRSAVRDVDRSASERLGSL
ncbi:hypothetical protein BURMUCF2_3024 [Burkholderia multivorans CF2]|nr:hypothetical protein BURMUCF2_3024 [Burkholderia multivorans CF2]